MNINLFQSFNLTMNAAASFRKKYCGLLFFLLLCCFLIFLHYNIVYSQMQSSYFQSYGTILVGWEYNKSRNATEYVLPNKITALISNQSICTKQNPPRILLIVCSGTENFILRQAIRKTWGYLAYEKFNISVAFLMGVSLDKQINENIRKESDIFNDVILEDFVDTYNNLTIKTLMLLKWVKHNCNNAAYIMKTDDDVYVNISNLILLINNIPKAEMNVLYGKLICSSRPVLDPRNKWYMPTYMYPHKLYPNYLSGVGYFMSTDVALKLYEEAFNVDIIHMEDVFITGICARRAGIRPARHFMFNYTEVAEVMCSPEDNYLIVHSHHVMHDNMYDVHNKLISCNFSENKTLILEKLLHSNLECKKRINSKFNFLHMNAYSYSC